MSVSLYEKLLSKNLTEQHTTPNNSRKLNCATQQVAINCQTLHDFLFFRPGLSGKIRSKNRPGRRSLTSQWQETLSTRHFGGTICCVLPASYSSCLPTFVVFFPADTEHEKLVMWSQPERGKEPILEDGWGHNEGQTYQDVIEMYFE